MKKLLLILAIAAFASSCGDDDSGSSGKVPTQIEMTSEDAPFNNVYQFQYESGNRLKSYSRSGAQNLTYVFHYGSANTPQSVSVTGDLEAEVVLEYDEEDRIVRVTNGNNVVAVTYAGENAFVLNNLPGTFEPNGDLQSLAVLQFSYDSKRGPFAHVKGVDSILMVLIETNMPYFATKNAVLGLTNTQDADLSTTVTQTYEGGLPIVTQVEGGAKFTMAFTYE